MALSNKTELNELVKRAMAAFNALSPEEKQSHRREQAISFAFGQAAMSYYERGHPEMTKEEEERMRQSIADAYDRRETEKKDLSEE